MDSFFSVVISVEEFGQTSRPSALVSLTWNLHERQLESLHVKTRCWPPLVPQALQWNSNPFLLSPWKNCRKTSQTSVVPTSLRKEVAAALGWKWEGDTRARESQSTGGLQSLTWEAHRARARAQAQCLSPRSEQGKSLRAVWKQNPRAKVSWRWGQSWNLLENWYKWLGYLWRTKVSRILIYQGRVHPPFTCLIHCSPASDPPH